MNKKYLIFSGLLGVLLVSNMNGMDKNSIGPKVLNNKKLEEEVKDLREQVGKKWLIENLFSANILFNRRLTSLYSLFAIAGGAGMIVYNWHSGFKYPSLSGAGAMAFGLGVGMKAVCNSNFALSGEPKDDIKFYISDKDKTPWSHKTLIGALGLGGGVLVSHALKKVGAL